MQMILLVCSTGYGYEQESFEEVPGPVGSSKACMLFCRASQHPCQAWEYDSDKKKCRHFIRDAVHMKTRMTNDSFVFGPKDCTFSTSNYI